MHQTVHIFMLRKRSTIGITKPIPQKDGIEAIEALYDGRVQEGEFHMVGTPSRLDVSDYVYNPR